LSENTVAKYRSKLNKKVDFDSISILADWEKSVLFSYNALIINAS
jgi:hypothetical protein